jgi:hypothetical protein
MLAFYAYVVLAADYDSFSELGGNPFVQRALQVVNNAQSTNQAGWAALGNPRNRYALVENLNNPQMVDLRKDSYRYHRLALDTFDKNPDQSREIILEVLKTLKKCGPFIPTPFRLFHFSMRNRTNW